MRAVKASNTEIDLSRPTISVPEAGAHFLNLGEGASYIAAKRGEIPVIKVGSRLRVPVSAMKRLVQMV